MNDHAALIDHISRLSDNAEDAAAGAGLAAAFINPDRIEIAQRVGRKLPVEWRDHFHLGLCFGCKARSLNNPEEFARDLARTETAGQHAIRAAIDACDRIEQQIRAERGEEPYRRWRENVTRWMAEHIDYPLAGVKSESPEPLHPEPAHVYARGGMGT